MLFSEWVIYHLGQRNEGQEGDTGHSCPNIWWLLIISGDYCRSTGNSTIYCPIWDSFDNAKMLNWIGWWGKEINWHCPSPTRTNLSSLVQVSINHSMRDLLPTTLHLPSIPLGTDRALTGSQCPLGGTGKLTHCGELAFCSIWFHLQDVHCPK